MKVKAVIMRPDRTNDVIKLKPKNIKGRVFEHGNARYFLDPDRFQVTWDRKKMGFRTYYSTYYYSQGISKPIPVPDFKHMLVTVGENGSTETDYKHMYDNGMKPEELGAIFNPWFYRVIAPNKKDLWTQIQFYLTIGCAMGIVYLIYLVANIGKAVGSA